MRQIVGGATINHAAENETQTIDYKLRFLFANAHLPASMLQ